MIEIPDGLHNPQDMHALYKTLGAGHVMAVICAEYHANRLTTVEEILRSYLGSKEPPCPCCTTLREFLRDKHEWELTDPS
jgi:hypothetical protein